MEIFLSVEKDGATKLFGTFEDAIHYAEANTDSTVKLLRDLLLDTATVGDLRENTYGYVEFTKGTYTLDLAGKTLTAGDWNNYYAAIKICDGCDMTITDSVGGKVVSEIDAVLDIRSGSHLTIEGGDYSALGGVKAEGPDSLTLKGGQFKQVTSGEAKNSVSPLTYLADGCAFMLNSGMYANESNVNSQYISGRGTAYWIDKVTVVSAPLIFHSQPRDKVYYLTMPDYEKWAAFAVEYSGGYPSKGDITVTGERTDGTVVYTNTVKPTRIFEDAINLWEFTTADSGQFRIKLEYNGYVLYSNTFTITMAVCEHPGYYEDYGYKCSQCRCDLAAAIVGNGKTTGYVDVADAIAAAQTEENRHCGLYLFDDVSDEITVSTGDFYLHMNGHTVGAINVTETGMLDIRGGTVTGTVTVAKNYFALLSATNVTFKETVNADGSNGIFVGCTFDGTLNSGIDKVEYLLSETPFADRDAIIGNWTAVTLDSDRKAYFSIAPNQKTFVYVRVTDKSGNITVVNSEGVVVYIDAEAVTDVQTFTMDSGSNVLYGLKLNGNALLAVYNGTEEIRSVTDYSLIENGANAVFTLKNKYLRTLAAGEYTLCLIFKPMGESYVDNYGNDAPTEIVLKLTVEKKTPTLDHKLSDGKIYDGKSIDNLTFNTDSDGALTFEYKRAGEDDTAYTTVAPKNVGKYIIRITTAETDTFKAATSTMEFEIQHREVTISDVKVSDKTYDGTTNATITDAGMKTKGDDWRLCKQEEYMMNAKLKRTVFCQRRVGNDHCHCEFCWEKFSENDGDMHVGYSTIDGRIWVCDDCFHDFHERFRWIVISVEGGQNV